MHNLDAGKSAFLTGFYTIALSLAMGHAAWATPVLDQSYTTLAASEYATAYDFQQGLTVGKAGLLSSIQLFLSNSTNSAESIEIRIASGSVGTVQSTWLFDQKISVPKKTTTAWTTISLSSANINVTVGESLIIDVYDYAYPGPYFGYSASTTGQYLYDRTSPGGASYALLFGGNYEMAFNTFVDPAAIPEPSTFALLGAGLIGFVAARRRRA